MAGLICQVFVIKKMFQLETIEGLNMLRWVLGWLGLGTAMHSHQSVPPGHSLRLQHLGGCLCEVGQLADEHCFSGKDASAGAATATAHCQHAGERL